MGRRRAELLTLLAACVTAIVVSGTVAVGFATDHTWLVAFGLVMLGVVLIVGREEIFPQDMDKVI